jgi:hypothetical protein
MRAEEGDDLDLSHQALILLLIHGARKPDLLHRILSAKM